MKMAKNNTFSNTSSLDTLELYGILFEHIFLTPPELISGEAFPGENISTESLPAMSIC